MNVDSTNETLDEIIFEHRNKNYGAYQLRKSYRKTISKSVLLGVSAFLSLTIATYIFANQTQKEDALRMVSVVLSDLPPEKPEPLPPKEKPAPEPIKEEVKTKQYIDIVPVEDDANIVETPPPTTDELKDSKISTETKEGISDESIFSAPPAETPVTETVITEIKEDNTVFTAVEVNPSFMGGMQEMYRFLGKNIQYPLAAQRNNIEGKVTVSFIVEKDGSISSVEVLKGLGFGCDEEAVRVVKMMPKWLAGKQNGNAVRVKFTIPIFYKLDN
jgi:protein TonB